MFEKKNRFESWDDLFNYWAEDAEYFKNLINISDKYRKKRQDLLDFFYKKLDEYEVKKSKGITNETYVDLYKKYAAEKMEELCRQENKEFKEFNRNI